jgi:hypothetical protein
LIQFGPQLFGLSQSILLRITQLGHLRIQVFYLRLQVVHRRYQSFYVGGQLRGYRGWSACAVLTSGQKRQTGKERGHYNGLEVELGALVYLHGDPL